MSGDKKNGYAFDETGMIVPVPEANIDGVPEDSIKGGDDS